MTVDITETPYAHATELTLDLDTVINLDVISGLRKIPSNRIHTVVSSPPYWGLRDYGPDCISVWDADPNCQHVWGDKNAGQHCSLCGGWRGQLGLEVDPLDFVRHLVQVMDEVKRVLSPFGTLWLNLGDSFFGGNGQAGRPEGWQDLENNKLEGHAPAEYIRARNKLHSNWLQPKQKLLIPERVAIAMQEHGWILRSDVVWNKKNGMPASVTDRFANKWEHIYLFVKTNKTQFYVNTKTGKSAFKPPSPDKMVEGVDYEMVLEEGGKDEKEKSRKVTYWTSYNYYFDLDALRKPYPQETIERAQRAYLTDKKAVDNNCSAEKNKKWASKVVPFNQKMLVAPKVSLQQPLFDSEKTVSQFKGKLSELGDAGQQYGSPRAHEGRDTSDLPKLTGASPSDVWSDDKWDNLLYEKAKQGGSQREAYLFWLEWKRRNPEGSYEQFYAEFGSKNISKYTAQKWQTGISAEDSKWANFVGYLHLPHPKGETPDDIWSLTSEGFHGAHFAVFPRKLVEMALTAGCPHQVCKKCGLPRVPVSIASVSFSDSDLREADLSGTRFTPEDAHNANSLAQRRQAYRSMGSENPPAKQFVGYSDCGCGAGFDSGVTLDTFAGSGTTLFVARSMGFHYVGIEVVPNYVKMIYDRMAVFSARLDSFDFSESHQSSGDTE